MNEALFDMEPVVAQSAPKLPRGRRRERTEWGVQHPPMPWCHDKVDVAASREHAEGMADSTSEIIERLTGRPRTAKVVHRTVVTFTSRWEAVTGE